jgi:hypothetical protein
MVVSGLRLSPGAVCGAREVPRSSTASVRGPGAATTVTVPRLVAAPLYAPTLRAAGRHASSVNSGIASDPRVGDKWEQTCLLAEALVVGDWE